MAQKSWRMIEAALVTFLFLLDFGVAESPGYYSFMHEATQAPRVSFYDYIIIGGGTVGIPLAATLSKNYSVLLLERGGSPYGNPNVTYAHNFGSYIDDKSPNSPSQQFIVEGVENARPRILGGGTSINAAYYTRGEAKFNKEAKLMDDDLIEDSYQWVEEVMVFEPNVWEWQSAFRAGLLEVGHTSADLLQYANPETLPVFVHAIAHKILFNTKGTSKPTAYGVEFEDSLGEMQRAFLKGPKEQLDALKIECVLEQPFVGKDMADNPLNALFIPSPIVVE
ncbi:HOTHEAD-like protein [Tanacetum coccineum]